MLVAHTYIHICIIYIGACNFLYLSVVLLHFTSLVLIALVFATIVNVTNDKITVYSWYLIYLEIMRRL